METKEMRIGSRVEWTVPAGMVRPGKVVGFAEPNGLGGFEWEGWLVGGEDVPGTSGRVVAVVEPYDDIPQMLREDALTVLS